MFLKSFLLSICFHFIKSDKIITDDRPTIETNRGNLILRPTASSNVQILLSAGGKFLINDQDVFKLTNWAQLSTNKLNLCQAKSETALKTATKVEDIISGNQGVVKRLEILENNSENATRKNRLMVTYLRRRVLNIQRKLRTLLNLINKNECADNPCSNGGTCQDLYNGYICNCPKNWAGPTCESDVNECTEFEGTELGCQNGATCKNKPGSYDCICAEGWFGIHCTKRSKNCSGGNEICGHGTCVPQNTGAGYTCICDQGWKTNGAQPACTVDINECESYKPPCSNNPPVKCINFPGSFYCGNCPAGYTGNGFYCSDIDECAIFNGGCSINPPVQCVNTPGSKMCGPCPPGYEGNGITCIYKGGACGVNNGGCHHLAQCRDNAMISSTYVQCVCPANYNGNGIGPNGCMLGNNPCASNPCINGNCSITSNGQFECLCSRRYTGTLCEIRKNPCDSNPCLNGGTCKAITFSYYCACPISYTGIFCQTQRQACGRVKGPTGVIEYPTPDAITSNGDDSCTWVIEVSKNKIINVTFEVFQFPDCSKHWLQINDGPNTANHLLGRYCSNKLTNGSNIVSTNYNLYLWFKMYGNSNTKPYFKLTWNETNPVCGGTIQVTSHGTFSSPGAPGVYPLNRDCYWKFIAEVGYRIQFHIFSLSLGINNDCSNDFLEFHEGLELTDKLLIKYCNTSHPEPLISTSHEVLAYFHSDSKGQFPGFQISYSLVAGAPGCGGILTAPDGTINSPSVSNKYPTNSLCEYKIKMPEASKIKLTFNSFQLEQSDNCQFDYLAIYDGSSIDSPLFGRYCGNNLPSPIISTGNQVLLVFKTDWTNQFEGFSISYKSVCGGILYSPSGIIQSDNYKNPINIDKKKECIYQIVQPQGTKIVLNINDIDFGNVTNPDICDNGYVEIRDGDSNATLIGKYCTKAPAFVQSSFNYLWIKYVEIAGKFKGIKMDYNILSSNGCGGILKANIGSVESPKDLSSFKNGLNCTWRLIAPENHVIQLTWIRFKLENSFNCTYDHVQVIDSGFVPEYYMGTYCGSNMPPTLLTSSNSMTVKFRIDGTNNYDGFLFTYTFINASTICGGKYFTSSGVIKSPHFPQNYPANQDCVWVITVPAGQQIMLNSTFFDIERFYKCRYDFIEIRNGGTGASPLIGKYCGNVMPKIIPSHVNQLYIRFKSDMTKSGAGFKFEWTSASTGCGGVLTSPMGTIISPHYPEPYHRNAECIWKIFVNAGSVVQLVFADLDMENHVYCNMDYVEIFDGTGNNIKSLGKFCQQSNILPFIKSTTNQVTVKFRSDMSFQGRGFQLQYMTICRNVNNGFRGVVESPNFPNNYPQIQNCLWELGVPKGNNINITFSNFDIRRYILGNDNCSKEYLEIKYEEDETQGMTTYGKYCGNEIPTDIQIKSNKTFINYVTDTMVVGTGFRLEWYIDGCGGILTHPTGFIETPNYPKPYTIDTQCDWIIQADFGKSIELTFLELDLEHSDDCNYDFIDIYNGPDDTYPKIHSFCRLEKSTVISSTGNVLFVRFYSDLSYNSKGFHATYKTLSSKCGGKLSAPSGLIHSPNYPKNFNFNDTCEWLIEVRENHNIKLDFNDVDFIKSNTKDYVKVYDGPTQAYPLLATITGSIKPNYTLTSTTNLMFVEMVTSSYITTKGFSAQYYTGCGATINTQSSGIIQFSSTVSIYNTSFNSKNCSWTIKSVRPDEHIYLTITHLDAICSIDNSTGVFVYNGESSDSPVIGKYCGTTIPPMIASEGSALHIFVDSNEPAFTAYYSVVSTTCGGTLESTKGQFASPNYPNNYPVDIQCEWIITISAGNEISLSFFVFELSNSINCDEDYLEIRENNSTGKLLGVFCSTIIPLNITAKNNLWIYFKSDKPISGEETVTAKGFLAEYDLNFGTELSGPSGQIASPLYPRTFTDLDSYSWTVTVKENHIVVVKFLDIAMDYVENNFCYFSNIEIFDGPDATFASLGTFCGLENPKSIKSTSNIIKIVMNNGINRRGTKFLLEWSQEMKAIDNVSETTVDKHNVVNELTLSRGQNYNISVYPDMNFVVYIWKLKTTPENHLGVEFQSINITKFTNCYLSNNVKIYNENKNGIYSLKNTVCNENHVNITYETSNSMKILYRQLRGVFNSTKKIGFTATVKQLCGGALDITESNGIIKIDNTTKSQSCQWNITARTGKTIKVEFMEFNMGNQENCKSYISLKNGILKDSPMLGDGKYCNESPATLETTENALTIQYYSLFKNATFKLKYTEVSISCGGTLTLSDDNKFEIINSPNYPNAPSPYIECIWIIHSLHGQPIMFDFIERFDLITSVDCNIESVELRNGGTRNSPLIGKYCNDMPSTQQSLENMMYIKFTTDTITPKNGFKANVSIATCGGTIRDDYGEIKSPGFNQKILYPVNADCKWTIIAPKSRYLVLEFKKINLPYGLNNCSEVDHVTITEYNPINDTEITIGTYCGRKIVTDIKSTSNQVFVYFKSNYKVKQFDGFNLYFNATNKICGGSFYADSGVITSPGYPLDSSTNIQCEWIVTVPKGRRIRFDIVDFDLINDFSQGLAFFNGDELSSYVMHLKVKDKQKMVRSSDNKMQVFFWSGKASSHRGFKAIYSSDEPTICIGSISEKQGVISTPNDTVYYCSWKKVPDPTTSFTNLTQTIAFTINADFPPVTNVLRHSGFYYIKLLLGQGETKTTIASITQSTKTPQIIRSVIPEITLMATSSRKLVRMNFTINYHTYECGGRISSSIGYITSPSFPNRHNDSVECAWLLEATENQIISINIITLDLGDDCDDAYLLVYNGDNAKHPRIGKYCRNIEIPTLKSQNNKLWIEYHYNARSSAKGFNITYEPIAKGCGGILHHSNSIIESINYPNDYPNNAECLWDLRGNVGYHIQFQFTDRFQIESSDMCKNDYVQLLNALNETEISKKYCGRNLPASFISNSNSMYVLFRSNNRVTGSGFRAQWKLGCGGIFEADDTKRYIVSPGYPENYENGLSCNYTILAPNKYINIDFEDFELEKGGCVYDKIVVYKSYKILNPFRSRMYPAQLTYCGTNTPPKIRLLNKVVIVFTSDKWIRKRGFKFSYTTQTCGGNITEPTMIEGVAETVRIYSFHDGYMTCNWFIKAPEDKRITIRFTNVTLLYNLYCFAQSITILDDKGKIASLCGPIENNQTTINSNNNYMEIQFSYITYSNKLPSFQAFIDFTYGPKVGCGGFINLTNVISKTIEQQPPGDNYECTWFINATSGYRIKIDVIPITNNCKGVQGASTTPKGCNCIEYEVRDGYKIKSDIIFNACNAELNSSVYYYTSSNSAQIKISGIHKANKPFKFKVTRELGICGNIDLKATTTPQYITTPSYPGYYKGKIRCVWQIKSSSYHKKIVLIFKEFVLNQNISDDSCGNKDRIEIIDKDVKMFNLNYEVIGTKKPAPLRFNSLNMLGSHTFCNDNDEGYEFYSESDAVQVSFVSNNLNNNRKRFMLEYKIELCNRNYTTLQGQITRTWYTANCSIYIIVPKNYTISLYFNKLTTFEVFDGDASKTKLLAPQRSVIPSPVFSTGNQLYLRTSNNSKYMAASFNTFDITYTSTDKGRGCGGDIYNFMGVLTSPLYPNPYTSSLICTWNLKVPLGLQMALRFMTFIINGPCSKNYIKITTYIDNQPNEHRFCENDKPAILISNVKTIVEYSSSQINIGLGWRAEFMAISPGTSNGLFYDDDYRSNITYRARGL